ncbi:unnamed protein product [Lymnaea stagnalis]|uniref:Uncharacterized protein n=1 Tax=Lymnaea stagnalis TaxID=6523 RepID=A0AAV2HSJ9_LYMST
MDTVRFVLLVFYLVCLSDLCASDNNSSSSESDESKPSYRGAASESTLSLASPGGRNSKPSSQFVNFIAVLIGSFSNAEEMRSGVRSTSKFATKIVPTEIDSNDGVVVLYGEQYFDNKLMQRILYVVDEKVRGEKFVIYPYTLTSADSSLLVSRRGKFELNKPRLLLKDLGYDKACTREIEPMKNNPSGFVITRWPFCMDNQKSPPMYTGTINCTQLVVIKDDVRYRKPGKIGSQITLHKTQSFEVPNAITEDISCFKNPCLS